MGLFRISARLTGPTGDSEEVELLVDTGATLIVVPRDLAGRLGLVPRRNQPIVIAEGARDVWPVAEVQLTPDGQEGTTPPPSRPAENLSSGVWAPASRLSACVSTFAADSRKWNGT